RGRTRGQRAVHARRPQEARRGLQALGGDGCTEGAGGEVQVREAEVTAGGDDPRFVLRHQGRVLRGQDDEAMAVRDDEARAVSDDETRAAPDGERMAVPYRETPGA